jgi:hypothetical protein
MPSGLRSSALVPDSKASGMAPNSAASSITILAAAARARHFARSRVGGHERAFCHSATSILILSVQPFRDTGPATRIGVIPTPKHPECEHRRIYLLVLPAILNGVAHRLHEGASRHLYISHVAYLAMLASGEFRTRLSQRRSGRFERLLAELLPSLPAPMSRRSKSAAEYSAHIRTTCVATQLEAGHAENAMPAARARYGELLHPAGRGSRRSCLRRWR